MKEKQLHDMETSRRPTSWPFTAPQPPHSRQEVEFSDGLRIWLRPIIEGGQPSALLRELGAPSEGVRIDLRDFVPGIEALDRTKITAREFASAVGTSLRAQFTRETFIAAAIARGLPGVRE